MKHAVTSAKHLVYRHRAWAVFIVFAMLGAGIALGARAATLMVSLEAEAGNLAGSILLTSDPSASGGKAVLFGPPRHYVSFGDSVASGDGIEYGWKWTPDTSGGSWVQTGPDTPVWDPATDTRPEVQNCHRSVKAYPFLVAAATGYTLYDPSCSGSSVVNGILGARDFGSGVVGAAQLGSTQTTPATYAPPNATYDAFKPDVVSMTLGMDDINFSDFLRKCYTGFSCVTTANDQDINSRLAAFKANLQLALAEIKNRGTTAGKVPWVVLTTYYDPFNTDSTISCGDTDLGLGQGLSPAETGHAR